MLLWLLLACSGAGAPPDASTIAYKDGTLQQAIERLEQAHAADLPPEEQLDPSQMAARILQLEERVSRMELEIVDLRNNGRMPAADVSYDPRVTTMDARNLQEAVDALSKRLATVEDANGQSMGRAGPGLFEIPQDGSAPPAGASNNNRPPGSPGGQPPQGSGGNASRPPGQGGQPGGQGGQPGGQGGQGGGQGGQGGQGGRR